MKPLVAIMISCYNHEQYIGECLESVLSLKYPRIELLIIDDASTDRSFAIINNYKEQLQEKAERLFIEKNIENVGIGKNRNKLLNLAKGDYLKFLDSDDFLMPDGIDFLVNYFEKNPTCSIVHGSAVIVDEKGDEIPKKGHREIPSGYNLTGKLLEGNFIYAPCAMISKKTIEKYGCFKEIDMGEDWEYWLRVSVDGRIDYVNEVISAYRVLQSSASHFEVYEESRFRRAFEEELSVFELYKQYATKQEIRKYYNSAIRKAHFSKSSKAIRIVKDRMKENNIKASFRTLIWIFIYKTEAKTYLKKAISCFLLKR